MRMFASMLVVVFSLVAVIPPAHAQTSHAAPQSVLDAAVQDHVATTAADRDTVLRLLERPEVQAVAGDIGLDLRRARSAVSTLEGQQLTDLAAQAQQVEQALAGGQSRIVISTTLIIIALLVLILIIVAVD
jgi:ABC-type sugar transport system substrate-binding protein